MEAPLLQQLARKACSINPHRGVGLHSQLTIRDKWALHDSDMAHLSISMSMGVFAAACMRICKNSCKTTKLRRVHGMRSFITRGAADTNIDSPPTPINLSSLPDMSTLMCQRLQDDGFVVVRCPEFLQDRGEALKWLEQTACEVYESHNAQGFEDADSSSSARFKAVSWPRAVMQYDVIPSDDNGYQEIANGFDSVQSLACSLHHVALKCLAAIAHTEKMPEILNLPATQHDMESLHQAKEPSLLRANMYPSDASQEASIEELSQNSERTPVGTSSHCPQSVPKSVVPGPCWHVDLGLLTVTPAGSWPALMASPFHTSVGHNAFLEELLDPNKDVLVFAGTTLAVATGDKYRPFVHGVSTARLKCSPANGVGRISLPYFLRACRRAVINQPSVIANPQLESLYPAAVEPLLFSSDGQAMVDLLRFHRDAYGRLCTRGQVVPLAAACSKSLL